LKHQEAWTEFLQVSGKYENTLKMKFALIPPGEFEMGSAKDAIARFKEEPTRKLKVPIPDWYPARVEAETPAHAVKISRPFLMGAHEVALGEFRQYLNASGHKPDFEMPIVTPKKGVGFDFGSNVSPNHPVRGVPMSDARRFCDWLSKHEQKVYRLPTEAEWEFACRAGTASVWSSGDNLQSLQAVAWTSINSKSSSHAVGSKLPNAFGLFDVHGNVFELCSDRFDEKYYRASPSIDPHGPDRGAAYVVRGGSYAMGPFVARSAFRSSTDVVPASEIGFRIVCEIQEKTAN
jgi:formylglycine-generating enzyme required for sulfatase activity